MDDPDTIRQNDGCGLEGRDSASEKRSVRGGIVGRKDYSRDKLTNGSKTLPDTDGRLRVARRFRDIAAAILVDRLVFRIAPAVDQAVQCRLCSC
jgi:hypothetical protein